MKKLSTFEFHSSPETLRSAFSSGKIPESLLEPVRAVITAMMAETASRPVVFYLCSSSEDKEIRDLTAYLLARGLTSQIESTLLVDCDFVEVGLSGVVPQKDSLGFLDMLLYGSSLQKVVQKTEGGVKVISAGSFTVTKKMPFALDAFESTARFIRKYSRCAIFCGPVEDDEGDVHPVAQNLRNVIIVQSSSGNFRGAGAALEERFAALKGDVLAVKVVLSGKEGEIVEGALREERKPPEQHEVERPEEFTTGKAARKQAGGEEKPGAGEATAPEELRDEITEIAMNKEKRNSLFPKIVIGILAALLVAFLFWWFLLTKPVREGTQLPAGMDKQKVAARTDTVSHRAVVQEKVPKEESTARADTQRTPAPVSEEKSPAVALKETSEPLEEEQEIVRNDTSKKQSPGEVTLQELRTFTGKYLIHISSFRTLERAKEDAQYLLEKGFPAFVVRVDLGRKGAWFRVCSGPMDTRDEALDAKFKLDELSRVKYSRIWKARR